MNISRETVVSRSDEGSISLLLKNMDNGGFSSNDMKEDDYNSLTKLIVWGGNILNHGEHIVSTIVHKAHEVLREVIYLPKDHKGGRMVRPHYHRGDRTSSLEFPNLRVLGYWGDMRTPICNNWIVPNLQQLYVFYNKKRNKQDFLTRWDPYGTFFGDQATRLEWPQSVLEQCPNLVEILICDQPDYNQQESYKILRRVKPPKPLEWTCLRILAIARHKDQEENCDISQLPDQVFDKILSFCHEPKWRVEDCIADEANGDAEAEDCANID